MKKLKFKLPVYPLSASEAQAFMAWFESEMGQAVLSAEKHWFMQQLTFDLQDRVLQQGIGFALAPEDLDLKNLEWIRLWPEFYDDQDVSCPKVSENSKTSIAFANGESLPFSEEAFDRVLLHHSLELACDPQSVLREAARVLVPKGQLIIVGFNVWSPWNLWQSLKGRGRQIPYSRIHLSPHRVIDWLHVLGFQVDVVQKHFIWPGKVQKTSNLGWVYGIVAHQKKRVITPIRPRWRSSVSSWGVSVVVPPATQGQTAAKKS